MTSEERTKLIEPAIKRFKGQFTDLERAIGVLMVGEYVGWRVLLLMHDRRTIAKYEKILGVKYRDVLPEKGPYSHRSLAFQIVEKIGGYWKAVRGEVKEARTIRFLPE